jgi:hypothetical protein
MHTIDFSEIKTHNGQLSVQDRFQGMLKYGVSWPQEVAAQERFISLIERDIDQRFTLLRNFPLPDIGVNIPLLLVGPPGIRVLLLTLIRGMFRAKESQWLELSGKSFRPAKDNLIHRTQLYVRATEKYFNELGHPEVPVDGLIVGMDPGMHVDNQHSEVRVVQFDVARRLAAQWNAEPVVVSAEEIYQIVIAMTKLAEGPEPEIQERTARPVAAQSQPDKFAQNLAPIQKKLGFSTSQWIILGLLLFGTVLVLIIMMFLVLISL